MPRARINRLALRKIAIFVGAIGIRGMSVGIARRGFCSDLFKRMTGRLDYLLFDRITATLARTSCMPYIRLRCT